MLCHCQWKEIKQVQRWNKVLQNRDTVSLHRVTHSEDDNCASDQGQGEIGEELRLCLQLEIFGFKTEQS